VPRGKRWFLTRRVSEEDSVAVRDHVKLRAAKPDKPERIYLSTLFLANRFKVNTRRPTLAYSLTLAVRVPDYEVNKKFWANRHYEGENLFRDSIVVEMTPPTDDSGKWKATYNWQRHDVGQSSKQVPVESIDKLDDGGVELTFPFATGDASPILSAPEPAVAPAVEYCYRHPDRETGLHCIQCGRPICGECATISGIFPLLRAICARRR